MKKCFNSALMLSLALFLVSCAPHYSSGVIGSHYKAILKDNTIKRKISSADSLNISFFKESLSNTEEYMIERGDTFLVRILDHPELSFEYSVLPDGKVSFAKIGVLDVAGLSVSEFKEKITREYKNHMIKPGEVYRISSGDKFSVRILDHPELSSEYVVLPDGKVSFIKIGILDIVGLSISEFKDKLIKEYKKYVIKPNEAYRVSSGDKFSIKIEEHLELSSDYVVLPDGNVSFSRIGIFNVLGLTLEELKSKLIKQYRDYISAPQLNIAYIEYSTKLSKLNVDIVYEEYKDRLDNISLDIVYLKYNQEIDSFLGSLKNGKGKPVIIKNVSSDGNISLPIVKSVKVLGLDTSELEEKLTKEYSKNIKHLGVNVAFSPHPSYGVAVLGEVKQPGIYPVPGHTTLSQALALAGGRLSTAKISSVIVSKRTSMDKVYSFRVNLSDVLKNGDIGKDVVLNPTDVVFVPRTYIANLDLFVDQYIRKLIPMNLSSGMFYSLQ